MNTKIFIIITGMLLSITASSQTLHPLTVGDKVPDITFHNILNYKDSVVKISDFKGKILILDFWATYCSNCISTFPHNHALQQQYKDKLQILNIGFEPKEKIKTFLENLEKRNGAEYRITTVTDERRLNELFPHELIPHLVWIGEDGTVKAITTKKELTDVNINKLLQDGALQVRNKKDPPLKKMPLYLSNDFYSTDSLLGYCILYKGYDPGTGGTNYERNIGHSVVGKVITNYSLLKIYEIIAYNIFKSMGEKLSNQKVIVSIPERDTSELQSLYGFDMVVPLKQADSLYPCAMKELNRMSGFQGSVCKQKMRCLVLKKTKDVPALHSTSTTSKYHLYFNGQETYMKAGTLSILTNCMNAVPGINIPVVDGTGDSGKVDIRLSGSNDIAVIRKDLQPYGLTITEEEREIHVLKITKPDEDAITKN